MKRYIKTFANMLGLDIHLQANVPFGVRWEQDVLGLLEDTAGPLTILDVGANVGQTAQSLVRYFPDSKIYSFEPVPETFATLCRNTARFNHVECVNIALGDKHGEATVTRDRGGRNTLLSGVHSEHSAITAVETVDAFCSARGIQRVNLLKTDTEGFEVSVLRGASGSLSRGIIDFVVAECDFLRRKDEPHGDFFEIHAMLAPLGFRVVSFYTGGADRRGWVWGNVLMMHEDANLSLGRKVSPNGPAIGESS